MIKAGVVKWLKVRIYFFVRQQAKQSLADTVTGSADGAILSMKPEELLQLLGEEA